ncbi:amino acid racemase [Epidermidibacterium keratini]|uniref:Amino acid racemase n=1 Tax=Epidermidibacterium keratini TaxID=1891644 RepID=A0A7L4YM75_9ACTN|nr:amino acid racemase [Epidermidibacterium keratini]QHC00385.1 amino acid racemase [Epidermidibacterium keratini]
MRTLGLIGGMSWHSTVDYYRGINERVAAELGGHHSAKLLMSSLDFDEIRDCQITEDWARAGALLSAEATALEAAGADAVAICTNLMHKVAPEVEASVQVPLLHIGDAVARVAGARSISTVGIVATDWVMRESFYRDRLALHGIEALAPTADERPVLDAIIWSELTRGIVTDESREVYVAAIEGLAARGAQGVVLACTEIQLLIGPGDVSIPVIDSMDAHASTLADFALSREPAPA